jgi:cytochrome c oxidase subunit 1
MTTMHALIMIFGAVMPAFDGSRELDDPAAGRRARHGAAAHEQLQLLDPAVRLHLLLSTLFVPGGAPAGGWTMYPPLSCRPATRFPMLIFAIHMMGISSIMGAINVIVTIMNMRAPGMNLLKMPLFVLVLADHRLPADRGDAGARRRGDHAADRSLLRHQLLQRGRRRRPGDVPAHLLVLRTPRGVHHDSAGLRHHLGDHPDLLAQAAVRREAMVYAIASIAFLSFIVWAHHMFAVGMPLAAQLFFMMSTMLIAVPTGVKVFNWTATMWKGSLTFEPPMLFAMAFLFLFTIGGFSGLMLAIVPADFQYQDTYFVVAHFHYVLVPGASSPSWRRVLLAAEVDRQHVQHDAGQVAFLAVDDLRQRAVLPAALPGLAGMPRRIPDYAVQFTDWNMVSSIGGFGFGLSQILFLYDVFCQVAGIGNAEAKAGLPPMCRKRRSQS